MAIPVLGIAHVNLNCRDLAHERAFFGALGLRATIHTDPAAQDCRAFGFEGDGRWDAWMLQGDGEPPGTALDLLEWKEPQPIGEPPRPGTRPGFERLGLTAADLGAARDAVLAGGGWASQIHDLALGADGPRSCFGATTREGQALLVHDGDANRLAHVGLVCTDLARSEAFYDEVFAMKAHETWAAEPRPAALFQPGPDVDGAVRWEARVLALPEAAAADASSFRVALTAWHDPRVAGQGLAAPHHAGVFRMAFLVEDIDGCRDELARLGVPGLSDVVTLDLGPSCPAPSCRALFFRDPDGVCLELIGAAGPA